jgi:large subunit ribosomal protein L22
MGNNIKIRKQKKLDAKANSTEASRAVLRMARVSAQKARLVADMIRGNSVDDALVKLKYTRKKSARMFEKLLSSALANASQKPAFNQVDIGDLAGQLQVKTVFVDQGPSLRRIRPRARGMAYRIHKKTSHLTIILEQVDTETIEKGS